MILAPVRPVMRDGDVPVGFQRIRLRICPRLSQIPARS
jgi:hypothetical protein